MHNYQTTPPLDAPGLDKIEEHLVRSFLKRDLVDLKSSGIPLYLLELRLTDIDLLIKADYYWHGFEFRGQINPGDASLVHNLCECMSTRGLIHTSFYFQPHGTKMGTRPSGINLGLFWGKLQLSITVDESAPFGADPPAIIEMTRSLIAPFNVSACMKDDGIEFKPGGLHRLLPTGGAYRFLLDIGSPPTRFQLEEYVGLTSVLRDYQQSFRWYAGVSLKQGENIRPNEAIRPVLDAIGPDRTFKGQIQIGPKSFGALDVLTRFPCEKPVNVPVLKFTVEDGAEVWLHFHIDSTGVYPLLSGRKPISQDTLDRLSSEWNCGPWAYLEPPKKSGSKSKRTWKSNKSS